MRMNCLVLLALASSLLSAGSCAKAEAQASAQGEGDRTVRCEAGLADSKALFGTAQDGKFPVLWTASDQVKVLVNNRVGRNGKVSVTPSEDPAKATFTLSILSSDTAPWTFTALSPSSAWPIAGTASGPIRYNIPAEQTPGAASPDPAAIVLASATAGPYADLPADVPLSFRHLTAYGLLSLSHLGNGDSPVTSIKLTADWNLTGGYTCDLTDGFVAPEEPSSTLMVKTSLSEGVFFACQRASAGGKELTVSVKTADGTLRTKKVTLPAGKEFKAGSVAKFTVDMTGAEVVVKSSTFDENRIVFSFGAMSDTHINGTSTMPANKFVSALRQLKTRAAEKDPDGLDAVVVAGDLSDTPTQTQTQMGYFKTLYEQELSPKEVPMIYTVGNHDANPNYWWTSNTVTQAKVMQTALGDDYFLTDQDNEMRQNFECRDCLVDGYHVLCITPNGTNPVIYSSNTMTWLNDRLKALTEAEPDKFVFVNTHPMIENTVYGSLLGTPMGKAISSIWESSDAWATRTLSDILSRYPQVVTFGGHLHFPLNDPRSIWQASFTSFGCASVRYMAIENGNYQDMKSATVMNDCEQFSQCWLIQLDVNGNMRASALDLYNSRLIGEPYEVSYPHADLSHLSRYGAKRAEDNKAPVLTSLTVKEKTLGTSKSYSAEWAAGEDDEFVHHYVMKLKRGNDLVDSRKYLADFYLHPLHSEMKSTWTVSLGSLSSGSYTLTLVAYDSWDAESNTLTKNFTVDNTPVPVVTGVYADIDFTGGTLSDSKGKLTLTNQGATIGKTSVSFGGNNYSVDALSCSASGYAIGQFNEILSFDEFKAFAGVGFSVEAFFVDKSPGTAVHGIVCGTQYGGWGLASRATGVPYFIVGEDAQNTYKNADAAAGASTTALTHVVGVYDPSGKKLKIYVNGTLSKEASISGAFYPGAGDTFNRFCLGADISQSSTPDFPCVNTVIVDAKIYTGALDADGVKKAYDDAVAALKK